MQILENLWEEGLFPSEESFERNTKYIGAIHNMTLDKNNFLDSLDERQQKLFEKFINSSDRVNNLDNYRSFVSGFRLGAKFIIDVYGTDT